MNTRSRLAFSSVWGGLLALALMWMPAGSASAKCGKHCRGTRANKKNAENACRWFQQKYKGVPCQIRKSVLCKSGWRTFRHYSQFGFHYRACVPKDYMAYYNKQRAQDACRAYINKYRQPCQVKRGASCGKGWKKVQVFQSAGVTFRACRKALKNETWRDIKNALNSTTFLVHAYKMYFRLITGGASTISLPAKLRNKYQRYYRLNLAQVRVGVSSKLKATGMTDCYKIYFKPSANMIAQISAGIFDSKGMETLFLHELAHSEQCYHQGGRNNYAKLWFRNAPLGFLRSLRDKKKPTNDNIHARMPMENQAQAKAVSVQSQVRNNKSEKK